MTTANPWSRTGLVVAAVGLLAYLISCWQEDRHHGVAAAVEQRLVEGIKARILQPERPPLYQSARKGEEDQGKRMVPLRRAAAADLFKQLEKASPISVVIAPKGDGTSTAARAFAADAANPHVIYVDLHGCDNFDVAAKRVAEAIGYRMTYTADEKRAKQAGFRINDLDKPWGPDRYDTVLRLFMRACGELRAARLLKDGRPPMLLLDHVSRPFGDSKRAPVLLDAPPPAVVVSSGPSSRQYDTLIYQTLESTKGLEAARQCRVAFITSDTAAELDGWQKSGARDIINYRALPAFTTEEATELLAHRLYFRLHPDADINQYPPADAVADIKAAYASTFTFLVGALGTRARTLALCIDTLPDDAQPLSDAELLLLDRGVLIPDALLPLLPKALPAQVAAVLAKSAPPPSSDTSLPVSTRDAPTGALRVDASALFSVETWLTRQQAIVEEVLFLDPDVVLAGPFEAPSPTTNAQRMVRRTLNIDAGLRALLHAGILSEVDFKRVCGSSRHLAPVLAEKHLVFYNLGTRNVEFDSDAVKQVVIGVLESVPHKARVELARTMLEWQETTSNAAALAQQPR